MAGWLEGHPAHKNPIPAPSSEVLFQKRYSPCVASPARKLTREA